MTAEYGTYDTFCCLLERMFVIFSSKILFSFSISVYLSMKLFKHVAIPLTFEHLHPLRLRDEMAELLGLLDLVGRPYLFKTLLVAFMLNLYPLFV